MLQWPKAKGSDYDIGAAELIYTCSTTIIPKKKKKKKEQSPAVPQQGSIAQTLRSSPSDQHRQMSLRFRRVHKDLIRRIAEYGRLLTVAPWGEIGSEVEVSGRQDQDDFELHHGQELTDAIPRSLCEWSEPILRRRVAVKTPFEESFRVKDVWLREIGCGAVKAGQVNVYLSR